MVRHHKKRMSAVVTEEKHKTRKLEKSRDIQKPLKTAWPVPVKNATIIHYWIRRRKSCSLDPIPTWILRKCIDELLRVISCIVNLSLTEGYMPQEYKLALLQPHLKKATLDLILKHYQPISNLSFVSKTIERAACIQIVDTWFKTTCMKNSSQCTQRVRTLRQHYLMYKITFV